MMLDEETRPVDYYVREQVMYYWHHMGFSNITKLVYSVNF